MEIEKRVMKVIAEQLGVEAKDVTPEKNLMADLGADSLDEIEVLMALEDEFGLSVDDINETGVKTIQQAIDFVKNLMPA